MVGLVIFSTFSISLNGSAVLTFVREKVILSCQMNQPAFIPPKSFTNREEF